jgi:uncharacterized phage protein (TIGR02220 family)
MSYEATKWAWGQHVRGNDKLVLLNLADRANDRHECWPSTASIEADTGLHRETVFKAIKTLEERGLIAVKRRIGAGHRYSVAVVATSVKQSDKPNQSEKTDQSEKADHTSPENHTATSPEKPTTTSPVLPTRNLSVESINESTKESINSVVTLFRGKEEAKSTKASKRADAICVLDYLNECATTAYRPVQANLSLIEGRLDEGYSVDRLRAIVDRKVAEWGSDPKMSPYLRPKTLFGKEKAAQYDGQTDKPLPGGRHNNFAAQDYSAGVGADGRF